MRKDGTDLTRKLIIDGNAVYEIDEECMLKNRVENNDRGKADYSMEKGEDEYRGDWKSGQENTRSGGNLR